MAGEFELSVGRRDGDRSETTFSARKGGVDFAEPPVQAQDDAVIALRAQRNTLSWDRERSAAGYLRAIGEGSRLELPNVTWLSQTRTSTGSGLAGCSVKRRAVERSTYPKSRESTRSASLGTETPSGARASMSWPEVSGSRIELDALTHYGVYDWFAETIKVRLTRATRSGGGAFTNLKQFIE